MKSRILIIFLLSIVLCLIGLIYFEQEKRNIVYVSYTNNEITTPLSNPYIGWAPFAAKTNYPFEHSLVYANVYWSDLEHEKGVYDFEKIENKMNLDYWASKNVKVIIRFILDYPNKNNEIQIPKWLYDEIYGDGTWYSINYGSGFSPNYENPILINYHHQVIEALGKRYNNNSNIAYIALGSLGHWGEWHTYSEPDFFIPFPPEEIAYQYVEDYIEFFPNKILMMRRPFTIAYKNNMGLFNDVLGDKLMTNLYLNWIENGYFNEEIKAKQRHMRDFWRTAPSGGEMALGDNGLIYFDNDHYQETLRQVNESHLSWIGPNTPCELATNESTISNCETIKNTLGYRYVIRDIIYQNEIKIGKTTTFDISIENTGIAPFYYKWYPSIVLLNDNNEIVYEQKITKPISKWLPGINDIHIELNVNKVYAGNYTVALGVIEPNNQNKDYGIKFANEEEVIPFFYKIGNLKIKGLKE